MLCRQQKEFKEKQKCFWVHMHKTIKKMEEKGCFCKVMTLADWCFFYIVRFFVLKQRHECKTVHWTSNKMRKQLSAIQQPCFTKELAIQHKRGKGVFFFLPYVIFQNGVWMFFIIYFWPVLIISVWKACNNMNNSGSFFFYTRSLGYIEHSEIIVG